jgi:hypothetical protein
VVLAVANPPNLVRPGTHSCWHTKTHINLVLQKIPLGFRLGGHASSQEGCNWAYSRLHGSHLSAYSRPATT